MSSPTVFPRRLARLVALALTAAVLAWSPVLAQDTVTITKSDFERLLKQMEELSGRVKTLESEKAAQAQPAPAPKADVVLKEDVEDLTERLDKVERKSFLDRLNLNAELRQRMDWFSFHDKTTDIDDDVVALPSTRLRINAQAEAGKDLIFRARLAVYKNWGDYDSPELPAVYDFNRARARSDATLRVERAYADYFFSPFDSLPMALTFGRLPTTDGLPTQFREDTPRKSTYPGLAYDLESDGAALSFMLDKLTGLENSALRFVYAKFIQDNDNQIYRLQEKELDSQSTFVTQFETALPFLDQSLFIMNYIYVEDFQAPPESLPLTVEQQAQLQALVQAKSPGAQVGNRLTRAAAPDKSGELQKLTFYLEQRDVLNHWLDWFAGFSVLKTDPSGEAASYNASFTTATGASLQQPGARTLGMLSNDGQDNHTGTAFMAGVRLNLPLASINNPKLGLEYNHGSKNWYGISFGSEDPLRKLETRGDAYEVYWIQPFTDYLFARLGYVRVNYDWTSSGSIFGEPAETDQTVNNVYFLLDARF